MHKSIFVVAVTALAACSSATDNSSADNSTANVSAEDLANLATANADAALNAADAAANASTPATDAAPSTGWTYTSTSDEMSGKPVTSACVTSENEVQLDAPYDNVTAHFCLRNHPRYGRDAFFALDGDGQIMCQSYGDPCDVRVRFDDGETETFGGHAPDDNSTNFIFIEGRSRFDTKLPSTKVMRVEVEFYQAGSQALRFNTAGLKWPGLEHAKGAKPEDISNNSDDEDSGD